LRWGLKKSCSPRQELSNGMYITYTQVNRVDSWLLVVESQTANLTPNLYFGHNLCFRCPNGSCEPILDICVSIAFQWYKKLLNPLGFDPLQLLFEHLEVHRDSNSQSGSSLGSVRVYPLTLSCTLESMPHDSYASLLARNLVSPYLGHEPKAKVVTLLVIILLVVISDYSINDYWRLFYWWLFY